MGECIHITRSDYDFKEPDNTTGLYKYENIKCIIWCNGLNTNDKLGTMDTLVYDDVMNVNINGIVKSLNFFIKNNKILKGARLCIISSILQNVGRVNKLSYSVSKSAIRGLVNTASIQLKDMEIYINAILPGPIENKMTKTSLTPEEYIRMTSFFVDPTDIINMCKLLCFNNNSITGQFFVIDNGLTNRVVY